MVEQPVRTEVLIVGAGPTGLAAAIELGRRGVACRVIDQDVREFRTPRAKLANVRSCCHLRRWGIVDQLKTLSPLGIDYPATVVFATRFNDAVLTRFQNAMYCLPGRNPLYPEHAQWVPQGPVEQVMRDHIQALPSASLHSGTALLSFVQTDDEVVAKVRDNAADAEQTIRCRYLIGADGRDSSVRQAINARLEGVQEPARNYNVLFRVGGSGMRPVPEAAIMHFVVAPDVRCVLGPVDREGRWFFMPTDLPVDFAMTDARAADMIRRVIGGDAPVEVLAVDDWVAQQQLADRYRDRRVFLAGDAAHLYPPFGGYGVNLGISDGVDLGWKIAAVLQGWGGPVLLDSYERERRPLHAYVKGEIEENHSSLSRRFWCPEFESSDEAGDRLRRDAGRQLQAARMREFTTLGVVLGCRLDDSPVVVSTARRTQQPDYINYVPSSQAGSLAPHAWLHDGSALYDHFGPAFTLVVRCDSLPAAVDQARLQAEAAGVDLKVLQPDEAGISALYPRRFTLIRPDQYVAWCADAWPHVSFGLFERVTGRATLPPHPKPPHVPKYRRERSVPPNHSRLESAS